MEKSNCKVSMLSNDIWIFILFYLDHLSDVLAVSATSKAFREIIQHKCKFIIKLPQSFDFQLFERHKNHHTSRPGRLLQQLLHRNLQGLQVSSHAMMTSDHILSLVRSYSKPHRFDIIAISKCFAVRDSIVELLNNSIEHLALCDMTFSEQVSTILSDASLQRMHHNRTMNSLILTNSTFTISSFVSLIRSLPRNLKFLALGGSVIQRLELMDTNGLDNLLTQILQEVSPAPAPVFESIDVSVHSPLTSGRLSESNMSPTRTIQHLSENLIVETTFLSPVDKDLLLRIFPSAVFVDLVHDDIMFLDSQISNIRLHSSLRSLLTNSSDCYNRSILHHACISGDKKRVDWLCRKMMTRVDLKDSKGATALQRAIENNHTECIETIIETHLSFYSPGSIYRNNIALPTIHTGSRLLKESDRRLTQGDDYDKYLLPVVSLLGICNHYCETPIYLAALYGREDSLHKLQRYIPKSLSLSILDISNHRKTSETQQTDLLEVKDENIVSGEDAIADADSLNCQFGCLSVFKSSPNSKNKTIVKGYDINEIIKYIETEFHIKIGGRLRYRFEDLYRLCSVPIHPIHPIHKKTNKSGYQMPQPRDNINSSTRTTYECSMMDFIFSDDRGYSPLHAAVINQSWTCVKLLLDMGCCVNYPNNSMETPLQLACGRYPHNREIIALMQQKAAKEM